MLAARRGGVIRVCHIDDVTADKEGLSPTAFLYTPTSRALAMVLSGRGSVE